MWNGQRASAEEVMDRVEEACAMRVGSPIIAQYYPGRDWQMAPHGQMPCAELSKQFYGRFPTNGHALVRDKYKGFKGLVMSPALEGKVKYVADQVCRFACTHLLNRNWIRRSGVRRADGNYVCACSEQECAILCRAPERL